MKNEHGLSIVGVIIAFALMLALAYFLVNRFSQPAGPNGTTPSDTVDQAEQAKDQVDNINQKREEAETNIQQAEDTINQYAQ